MKIFACVICQASAVWCAGREALTGLELRTTRFGGKCRKKKLLFVKKISKIWRILSVSSTNSFRFKDRSTARNVRISTCIFVVLCFHGTSSFNNQPLAPFVFQRGHYNITPFLGFVFALLVKQLQVCSRRLRCFRIWQMLLVKYRTGMEA